MRTKTRVARQGPSFPSSAWERASAKLRFASPRDDVVFIRRPHGKQSFPDMRSQAELGNEALDARQRSLGRLHAPCQRLIKPAPELQVVGSIDDAIAVEVEERLVAAAGGFV